MGLLDDAIREHLDLKRRRGADPAEVERLEREALGPVRRGPAPLEAGTEAATGYDDPGAEEVEFDSPSTRPEVEALTHGGSEPEDLGYLPDDSYETSAGLDYSERSLEDEAPLPAEDRAGVGPLQFRPRSLRDRLLRREPHPEDGSTEESAIGATPTSSSTSSPPREPGSPAPYAQETVEYRAFEDDAEVEEEAETETPRGDAILEETPEFLQDTPDHDRLWFEQRPPRDFDFDG